MTSAPLDFASLEVSESLPDRNGPDYGDDLPPDLVGATIVRFGAAPRMAELEGGGLIIDFVPKGSAAMCRVVFGLNESGMWVEFSSA